MRPAPAFRSAVGHMDSESTRVDEVTTVRLQVYMNNAARQQACPTYLSGGAVPAKQTCSEGTLMAKDSSTEMLVAQCTAPSAASLSASIPDHSQLPSSAAQPASSRDHSEGRTDSVQPSMAAKVWTGPMQGEAQVAQHHEAHLQKPLQLEEAEIDWTGEESAQLPGEGQADSDVESDINHAGWSDSDAEEYDPEATPQSDEEVHDLTDGASPSAAQHATHRGHLGRAQKDLGQKQKARINSCSRNGMHAREGVASAVHDATLRYVKAILKPLYAAQAGFNPSCLHAIPLACMQSTLCGQHSL